MFRASSGSRAGTSIVLLLAAAALAGVGCGRDPAQEESTWRPNVLIYLIDTLRADSLEPYGNTIVDTPAIERFAEEGVLFEQAHAHSSWTRPSIASILTGLAPDAHHIVTRRDHAAPDLRLLSEILREQGYATGAIITNPNVGSYFGFDQGYDDFQELYRETGGADVGKKDNRAPSDEVTRRAIEWMEGADRPFFLFVVTIDPHWPYAPPARFDRYRGASAKSRRRPGGAPAPQSLESKHDRYLGEVAFNDDSFGRLLDHMRERGSYDETLIVFTSDHGEAFGEHDSESHGKTLFAETIRVPLIIRRPGEEEPGRRVEAPVQLVDVFPTVLDALGLSQPLEGEGRPLPPAAGDAPPEIYGQLRLDGYSGEMLLQPPWKLISPNTPRKGARPMKGGLFNLDVDPAELSDLQDREPERTHALQERLAGRLAARKSTSRPNPPSESGSDPKQLPKDVKDALEALGYLESEEGSSPSPSDDSQHPNQ